MNYVYDVLFVCVIVAGVLFERELSESRKQYRKLEKKYNELARKTGNDELATDCIPEEELTKIRDLKEKGKTVRAIRQVRITTGMDLLAAKQYVDQL